MKDFLEIIANLGVAVGYSAILLWYTLSKISKALDSIVDHLNALEATTKDISKQADRIEEKLDRKG